MKNESIQALTKQNELLETEIELPLTIEEKQELQECEYRIQKAKETIENEYLIIAQELSKIRAKKLYREEYKTFAEYIKGEWNLTREYGQNSAQIGDFVNAAGETLQLTSEIGRKFSRNSISEMVVETNRLGKYLGLKDSEFNTLKPIIQNSINIMIESVPKARGGSSPNLVPRTIEQFYKALNEFIEESVIEVDGESMAVGEAKEKNLLNQTSCKEVIPQLAEHILENSEEIDFRAKANYGRKSLKSNESEKIITTKWRSSELLAKEYFESLENVLEVEDVSESNLGYDLEIIFKDNRRIYVEVKKVSSFNDTFKLTNNEFANATKYAEDYYVALVIHDPFQISFISNPVAELEHKKVIEQISWKFGDYSNNLQKDF